MVKCVLMAGTRRGLCLYLSEPLAGGVIASEIYAAYGCRHQKSWTALVQAPGQTYILPKDGL